jgi:hypothetical protein
MEWDEARYFLAVYVEAHNLRFGLTDLSQVEVIENVLVSLLRWFATSCGRALLIALP